MLQLTGRGRYALNIRNSTILVSALASLGYPLTAFDPHKLRGYDRFYRFLMIVGVHKMRIGIYKDIFANNRGADIAVKNLAARLAERGHGAYGVCDSPLLGCYLLY